MKKILVTGAAGTIGILVLKYLLSEGKYEITALDLKNKHSSSRLKKYRRRVNLIYGDCTDSVLMNALVKGHDCIIHLAGVMPPLANLKSKLMELNDYEATQNIVRSIVFDNPQCHLIYASATTVYGGSCTKEVSVRSRLKPNPSDYYSQGKVKIEQLIRHNLKNYIIFRLPMVLGNLKTAFYLTNGFLNEKIEVITAEDAAYAFSQAIAKSNQLNGKIFNLAGGPECRLTYRELLLNILKYYGLDWTFGWNYLLAPKEYHGFCYRDSNQLESILHFQNDSVQSYLMRQKRKKNMRQINILGGRPLAFIISRSQRKIP